jgi:hypothetical protein
MSKIINSNKLIQLDKIIIIRTNDNSSSCVFHFLTYYSVPCKTLILQDKGVIWQYFYGFYLWVICDHEYIGAFAAKFLATVVLYNSQ